MAEPKREDGVIVCRPALWAHLTLRFDESKYGFDEAGLDAAVCHQPRCASQHARLLIRRLTNTASGFHSATLCRASRAGSRLRSEAVPPGAVWNLGKILPDSRR